MAAPSHRRRTISELDMSSMRRISDALLLAQNRARRATDRANQAEHLLRLVLAQVDVNRLCVDSLADQEVLQATITSNSLLFMNHLRGRSASAGNIVENDEPPASMTSSRWLQNAAKGVVTHLKQDMTRQKRYMALLSRRTYPVQPSLWSYMDASVYIRHAFFMAGLLLGVVAGVVVTKQWQLQDPHCKRCQEAPSLLRKLAKWSEKQGGASTVIAPWRLISMPMDELSYLIHPAIVDVA
uniref:Uncharacterized protein n=1 Tax=Hyaloperonospora arabidopsidis (strain Emoy2) TaxID=559515 RepID=M4BJ20_HYAAE